MLLGPHRGFDLNQHIIVERLCGILDDGLDILNREIRIGLDNLSMRHAMGEQAQDMVNTETRAFDDRFPAKNLWIGHDTTHRVHLHGEESMTLTDDRCVSSRCLLFKPIFMMQTTQDRTGHDTEVLWHAVSVCLQRHRQWRRTAVGCLAPRTYVGDPRCNSGPIPSQGGGDGFLSEGS